MLTKNTMTIVATTLANIQFKEHCEMLDTKIEESLREAFKDERISQERLNRIVEKFCSNMLGE